ncbi:endonuclease/exonuclease/phosphatase family protein [Nocardioides bruguierae]|uniref:Endonuclease/exonuclease/phosphatase family protein n=1 Tax=Nocardioides bruguierae TaxID=2945102 RepID=A0A9X2D528_9ACTN|nr:endonuclease/exonuclease/phosphatase family protein [Nocardioides bruguierae]MCM0619440.1 endonuclease/exonuclease/phosphatase family protein [Nocardioides bruguierae]
MRIGTWNLAGRWSEAHRAFVVSLDCDVLLLTEVSERVRLPGLFAHTTAATMARRRRWAGVYSRDRLSPLADPHGATALAQVDGLRVASTVLPWRASGGRAPWIGVSTHERTVEAVDAIVDAAPAVWGGDLNHAFLGREYSGSLAGRRHLLSAIEGLGLQVPTAQAPHQIEGLFSIDHVAVPASWTTTVEHHSTLREVGRLSDHDAYVVEAEPR